MSDAAPVEYQLLATMDQRGAARANLTTAIDRAFVVDRITCQALSDDATDYGDVSLYKGPTLIDSSGSAINDVSEVGSIVVVRPGDQLNARWAGCTPGVQYALTITGFTQS